MRGAIAAGHPLTAEAGARILAEGGNAVDACIAAALASWVAESPLTGPGAGGFMLVHRARDRTDHLLDFFVAVPGLGRHRKPAEMDLEPPRLVGGVGDPLPVGRELEVDREERAGREGDALSEALEAAGDRRDLMTVVPGGATRQASVRAGLSALWADVELVLVHDAARALTPPEVFASVIEAIDAGQAANGSTHPDFFALKVLSYIDTMFAGNRGERVKTPTAIVLCKGDFCPEVFNDTRRFAEANLNRLWNMCESRFENVAMFACSVVGSLGYATTGEAGDQVVPVPLHTALQGVLEPFEWIISQL